MTWLKFDCSTPEKPEVLALTILMGWDDPDLTVGKLFKVWRWFDQHTVDGNAPSVTLALLSRMIGVTNFAENMQKVGWLSVTDTGILLPNFDRHNGETAKKRALSAKRTATFKLKNNEMENSNAPSVTIALPREEKRREEKKQPKVKNKPSAEILPQPTFIEKNIWDEFLDLRKKKRAVPITKRVVDGILEEAKKAGITFQDAILHCLKKQWQSFDASWYGKQTYQQNESIHEIRKKTYEGLTGRKSGEPRTIDHEPTDSVG